MSKLAGLVEVPFFNKYNKNVLTLVSRLSCACYRFTLFSKASNNIHPSGL